MSAANFLIAFLVCSAYAFGVEGDREKIVNALQQWPEDFNAKNTQAVCALFAPDLIASYPGTQDRNYKEMCRHLTAVLSSTDKTYRYEAPKIEQVIIEGDLAVVRLIWTLQISTKKQTEKITEKGLDVFKRQKDGSWKIAISYAYPK